MSSCPSSLAYAISSRHNYVGPETAAKHNTGRLIIFDHIPKTAGTTLRVWLGNNNDEDLNINSAADIKALAANRPAAGSDVFISGHEVQGVEALLGDPRDVYYLTMLRHPLALSLSFFNYRKLRGMFDGDMHDHFRQDKHNRTTSWLANGDLELAKARLERFYFSFGIVERFDESLRLLANLLGYDQCEYDSLNATGGARLEVSGKAKADFRHKNELDYELYEFACNLLQERISTAGIVGNKETATTTNTEASTKNEELAIDDEALKVLNFTSELRRSMVAAFDEDDFSRVVDIYNDMPEFLQNEPSTVDRIIKAYSVVHPEDALRFLDDTVGPVLALEGKVVDWSNLGIKIKHYSDMRAQIAKTV